MSRMPVLFVAHGAPLVAIEPRRAAPFAAWGARLPRPAAVLAISAHWEATPLHLGRLTAHDRLVYDFGRSLPPALFEVQWPAPGAPSLAERVRDLLGASAVSGTDRGLDHGVWTVLRWFFPAADVPVLQLSMPHDWSEAALIDLGRALAPLRDEGVLIVGSGNLVHNLRALDWSDSPPPPSWALAFDRWIADRIDAGDLAGATRWREAPHAAMAHPTPDHLRPIFPCLGAADGARPAWVLDGFEFGSVSRRSAQFG